MRSVYSFLPTDFCYKVHEYNDISKKWEFLRFIQFGDILNSQINIKFIEENTSTINLKNENVFLEIYEKSKKTQLLFERLIYNETDENTGINSQFNQFLFLLSAKYIKTKLSDDNDNDSEQFTLFLTDFKGFVEKRKIVEHTKFYSSIPIDPESGDPQEPDDFNKVKYNLPWEDIVVDIYSRNIQFPVARVKGKTPYFDDSRKVKGFGSLVINNSNFPNYSIMQEKVSILDFKIDAYNYFNSINLFEVYKVEMKLINGLIKVVYNPKKNLEIDNIFSKDTFSAYTYNINNENYFNDIIVESDETDFDYKHATNLKNNDITSFEIIESGKNDEENPNNLQTIATSKLEENRTKLETILEIEFKEKIFLKDFTAGDFVNMSNFANFINGNYIIKEIEEMIEEDYITYTISDMEKID